MLDRNPINFADDVRGAGAVPHRRARQPLPVSAGDGLRGPARGARAPPRGVPVRRRDTARYDIEEEIRQQRTILEFLAEHVPGVTVPTASPAQTRPGRTPSRVLRWRHAHVDRRSSSSALLLAFVIWRVGIAMLRSVSTATVVRLASQAPRVEDVEELDVFLVCGECGTELQVTRLGELQIPRHCGEPMQVHPASRAGGLSCPRFSTGAPRYPRGCPHRVNAHARTHPHVSHRCGNRCGRITSAVIRAPGLLADAACVPRNPTPIEPEADERGRPGWSGRS